MRVVSISDTHCRHEWVTLPAGDLLVHAGDITNTGSLEEVEAFLAWFGAQPHATKIFCAGNHDFLFEQLPVESRWVVPPGVTYLQDEAVMVNGLKVWGSPWVHGDGRAFTRPRGPALAEKWSLIPSDTNLLITHMPPHRMLDKVPDTYDRAGGNIGCQDLAEAVNRIRPRLHIFGHAHSGHGSVECGGITFVNAASTLNQKVRVPVVVDI